MLLGERKASLVVTPVLRQRRIEDIVSLQVIPDSVPSVESREVNLYYALHLKFFNPE